MLKDTSYLLFIIGSISLVCGCRRWENSETKTSPVSVKQYETPIGADNSVPAELGGFGFKREGWKTNEKYNIHGNPDAVKGGLLNLVLFEFSRTLRITGKGFNNKFNLCNNMLYETLLNKNPVNSGYIHLLSTH